MGIRSRHSYYKSTGLRTLRPLKSTHLLISPSEPMNKCFRSYPVLSFFSPPLYPKSMIGPPSWGSTTSTPSTVECKLPYLKNMYSLNLKTVIGLYFVKYNKTLVVWFYTLFISFYYFLYQASITQLLINVEIQVSSDSYVINRIPVLCNK